MKKKPAKNLLERFSCFLVGGGKKISGHKILMESLFYLRQNNSHIMSPKSVFEKDKNFGSQNPVGSQNIIERKLVTRSPIEAFKDKEKIIRQFLFLDFKNMQQKLVLGEKGQQYNQMINTASNYENNSELLGTKRLLNKHFCLDSVENAKPILETRKIRKGRVTYKVPKVTSSVRQEGKAISLLIENANLRKKNQLKRSASFLGDGLQNLVSSQGNGNLTDVSLQIKHQGDAKQSTQNEKTQNRVDFTLPFLFSSQIFPAVGQSSVKTSLNSTLNSIFLIMPSGDQSFDKKSNTITQLVTRLPIEVELEHSKKKIVLSSFSSKREQDATNCMKENSVNKIDKNLFFLPKKKDLLANIQRSNIKYNLSEEFLDSASGKGGSIEKKKQLHNIALQNRAYQHFRWW